MCGSWYPRVVLLVAPDYYFGSGALRTVRADFKVFMMATGLLISSFVPIGPSVIGREMVGSLDIRIYFNKPTFSSYDSLFKGPTSTPWRRAGLAVSIFSPGNKNRYPRKKKYTRATPRKHNFAESKERR